MENITAIEASKSGDLKKFIGALKNGAYEYYEYLYNAVINNQIKIVKYLIKKDYVTAQDAAIEAIEDGRWEILDYVLKTYSYDIITSYTYMIRYNRAEFISKLLPKIKKMSKDDIIYIYKQAAQYGHLETFKEIYKLNNIDNGVLVKYIIKNGRLELFRWFTENTKNEYLLSSLKLSIKYGYNNILKFIVNSLKNKKDILNIIDDSIKFAESREINRSESAKLLKKLKTTINGK